MLHRDQQRIDRIGYLIQKHALLVDEDIHQLAHDLGDIEDAAFELSKQTDRLLAALECYQSAPKDCYDTFGWLCGLFMEFRKHMRSAKATVVKAQRRIKEEHPEVYADDE